MAIDLSSGIVVGTNNRKKLIELRELLQPLGFQLQSLAETPGAISVEESGTTFMENARLKATVQAQHLGRWTIGEDSGLCVPALGGEPGVYSARYSGADATDESNNRKLLEKMADLTGDARRAYYVSTIALSDPSGQIHAQAQGECWGRILTDYRGTGGFGYDPLFEIPEYHRTFAELGLVVKSALSHRARALRQFVRQITG
ncbi:MAG: RdgB/HAM1 family non-canonical purine NTP pyrophosphatase [Pirellulaceae bacterium]|nr:RdgB/HAM1 family non-canonical purine NTP pyrophosphatase [Pirellulaceae bacterium]